MDVFSIYKIIKNCADTICADSYKLAGRRCGDALHLDCPRLLLRWRSGWPRLLPRPPPACQRQIAITRLAGAFTTVAVSAARQSITVTASIPAG